jgi:hypothetical protein
MEDEYNIKAMSAKIRAIRETATELKSLSGGIESIDRNIDRILANVKMLEMEISDAVDILEQ